MSAATDSLRAAATRARPAGFAARLGALLADLLLAALLLQLIAPPAYVASGGRAQLLNAPFGAWRCEALSGAAAPMQRAMGPQACRRTLFGHPFASAVTEGAGAQKRAAGPVDAAGQPVAPLDLGWLSAPLFVAVRLWFEAFAMRSPGRAMFAQRLVAENDGAVGAGMALRRYAALIGPFVIASWLAAATIRFAPPLEAAASGAAALAMLLVYGAASLAVLRGRAPFHDRAGGTRVVSTRP